MNETASVPGESLLPESTGLITSIHLGLILLLAIGAIAIIVIGIARKRRRTRAEQAMEERIEEAEAAPPPPAPTPAPTPSSALDTEPPARDADRAAEAPAQPAALADEPIAAAAPQDASPAAEAVPGTAARADDAGAPVTQLKGLGPKVAARLAELGITSVGQVAALSDGEARDLDAQLGAFAGRMERDRWRDQARLLAAGDRAGFEATYGRL